MQEYVLSVKVVNNNGVLLRVSSLFSRRCFSIKSLNAAETEVPEISRLTIVVAGDLRVLEQIKNQLMKPVTYRYTYHQYAKMDNRPIWSLLYDIGSTQKVGRVLMKASEDFWKEFEKRMPGQIRIPQEEVVALTYKSIEKKLREQGYFKDHPEMDFEEGIKQLRQKGTEMGGRDDELTGEDFHGEKVEMKNGTRTDTIEAAKRRMEKK